MNEEHYIVTLLEVEFKMLSSHSYRSDSDASDMLAEIASILDDDGKEQTQLVSIQRVEKDEFDECEFELSHAGGC